MSQGWNHPQKWWRREKSAGVRNSASVDPLYLLFLCVVFLIYACGFSIDSLLEEGVIDTDGQVAGSPHNQLGNRGSRRSIWSCGGRDHVCRYTLYIYIIVYIHACIEYKHKHPHTYSYHAQKQPLKTCCRYQPFKSGASAWSSSTSISSSSKSSKVTASKRPGTDSKQLMASSKQLCWLNRWMLLQLLNSQCLVLKCPL